MRVRDLCGLAERTAAAHLLRQVFGYTDPAFGVSPRLLAALQENSGTALGAFDAAGTLVGFCYGFTAVDAGVLYHYSQATVVAPGAQGAGVGRQLKHAQAAAARLTGARSMRWTFDPYALRNAHFNFAVLGAYGIRFLPDYYEEGDTDRVLVQWNLAPEERAGTVHRASVAATADDRFAAPAAADREWLRRELLERFAEGKRLVDVERRPGQAIYRFAEQSAERGLS